MGKAAGGNQEFCGPMAKQQRMFIVTIIAVYCGLAPGNWQPAWAPSSVLPPTLEEAGGWGIMAAGLVLIIVGGIITAIRRLRRIAATLRKLTP
jgi:hypothetical protein